MYLLEVIIAAMLLALPLYAAETPRRGTPLPRAHAHNDYEHPRPLLDALENGFCGIEADVHLVNGELLVAHDSNEVKPGRTLEKLYLEPLWEFVKQGRGRVYAGGPSLMLLIDIKTNGEETYRAVRSALEKYPAMLTHFEPDNIQTNAVTVIISGNRPRELMLQEKLRLAAYDGRLSDLPANPPPAFVPLISDNWRNHFTWDGSGEIPPEQLKKVKGLVRQTHAQGKKLRFWAVPDHPAMWQVLLESGVDWINTDRLTELRTFLFNSSK